MLPSVERLLKGIFDYAGLFPPASLDLAEAVERYLRYRGGTDAWIMSRLVCSSAKLGLMTEVLAKQSPRTPIQVTVAGRPSRSRETWEAALEQDVKDMNAFLASAGEFADIEAYEVRVPDHDDTAAYLRDLNGFRDVEVYVELPWAVGLDDALAFLSESDWLGAKGRTGGTDAAAFPAADQLAGFLSSCVALEVPFKLTAGLHHPFPTWDAATGAQAHGFMSVLGTTALALAEDLSRSQMSQALQSPAEDWTFSETSISWRGNEAPIQAIDQARDLFVAIGSCSIDEPLDDLASEGLITK